MIKGVLMKQEIIKSELDVKGSKLMQLELMDMNIYIINRFSKNSK